MDLRTALKQGDILELDLPYHIINEIDRGHSCIVYDAYYYNNLNHIHFVRIKEFYPLIPSIIRRNQELIINNSMLYTKMKQELLTSCDYQDTFLITKGLCNYVMNMINIFTLNHTYYIVSTYIEGVSLANKQVKRVEDQIRIALAIAKAIKKIHELGFLYLDLKPDNIYIIEGSYDLIKLFDFDYLGIQDKIERLPRNHPFMALEVRNKELAKIGKASDIYSIGAILYYMIYHHAPSAYDCMIENYDVCKHIFKHTLKSSIKERYSKVDDLIEDLESILYLHKEEDIEKNM